MNCKKCGNPLPNEGLICKQCGTMITKDQLEFKQKWQRENNNNLKVKLMSDNYNVDKSNFYKNDNSKFNKIVYFYLIVGIAIILTVLIIIKIF